MSSKSEKNKTNQLTHHSSGNMSEAEQQRMRGRFQDFAQRLNDGLTLGIRKQVRKSKERGNDSSNDDALTFPNTTVPVSLLFIHLSEGKTYKDFLRIYDNVKEADVLAILEAAQTSICKDDFRVWSELMVLRQDIEKLSRNTGAAFEQLAEIVEDGFDSLENQSRKK